MSVTVSNPQAISDPIVMQIEAHTEAVEAIAACQGQALENIANNTVCATPTAEAPEPTSEGVCCTSETFVDDPEPGFTRERLTCSDGTIKDIINYPDGDCQVITTVKGPQPTNSVTDFDENGNLCLVGAVSACPPRNINEPYPAHFIPRLSDFGNPIFCVPGYKYALAWTGVDSKNLKQWLDENSDKLPELNDITIPASGDSIRAEVGGIPYMCGVLDMSSGMDPSDFPPQSNSADPQGLDGAGNPYYCFPHFAPLATPPGDYAFAHTTDDPLAVDATTIAMDVDGNPIPCPTGDANLIQLQIDQANRLNGCFGAFGMYCPEWSGQEETAEVGGGEDMSPADPSLWDDLLCNNNEVPSISGKTAQSAYYTLWSDWWKCEKRSKCIQQRIYAAQVPLALYSLYESLETYKDILGKNLEMICDTQENKDLVAQCSNAIIGTPEEPGILKQCESALLEGHGDRIGLINNRGMHACDLADSEFDCYDKLWKPIQHEHAHHLSGRLNSMIDNGFMTSENAYSWATKLDECITENMLPELKRQFAPIISSAQCPANHLNEWRADLRQKAVSLGDHFDRTYKKPEATMIPAIMDMTTCMVERICELRDWLVECGKCDQEVYKEGYQYGEVEQARAAMSTSAALIPKIKESVSWLDRNIPYAENIFKVCYGETQGKLNPLLYKQATELAPEITKCYAWFSENACDSEKFFETCYKDAECSIVKKQTDLARSMVQNVSKTMERLDTWGQTDRDHFDNHLRSRNILGIQTVADNGTEASNKLTKFGNWLTLQSQDFRDTYVNEWQIRDLDYLKRHWQLWDRDGDPLMDIQDSAGELSRLSKAMQGISSKGIQKVNTYLDEVFEEADRFDYCVETPAYLHVRNRVDDAIEQLERCTPQYSSGHLLAAKAQLKTDGARAEGAAYDAATRWKWWANRQMEQLSLDRRENAMRVINEMTSQAIALVSAENQTNDYLLKRMDTVLERGDRYLSMSQEMSNLASSGRRSEVEFLLRGLDLSHFWPQLARQESGDFLNQYNTVMDDANQLLQLGHFWPEHASRDKNSANSVLGRSIETSLQLNQLGQFFWNQAQEMNQQRATNSIQAGSQGNSYAQTGHNLHKIAADKVGNALQQSIAATQPGLGASEIGARHIATSLDVQNSLTLNALEHIKAGISSLAVGLDFLKETRQSYDLSGSYGLQSGDLMMRMFRHGEEAAFMGLRANEQCSELNYKMLCKAKDYLQDNHKILMTALHGGDTLGNANELLEQIGANAGGAFGLLGNSLEGLSQNSSPFPFPAFGAQGLGFNGAGF